MADEPQFPEAFYKAAEDKGFTLRGVKRGTSRGRIETRPTGSAPTPSSRRMGNRKTPGGWTLSQSSPRVELSTTPVIAPIVETSSRVFGK